MAISALGICVVVGWAHTDWQRKKAEDRASRLQERVGRLDANNALLMDENANLKGANQQLSSANRQLVALAEQGDVCSIHPSLKRSS